MAVKKYELRLVTRVTKEGTGFKDTRDEAQRLQQQFDKSKSSATGVNSSLVNLASGLYALRASYDMIAGAAQAAYETIDRGATLQKQRQNFDALAESIGTTGAALRGDLREATKGMVSDSELIASAADLINTGLASTEDQTVRLATAVATMGLDMQQLTLTMLNNSEMRLDSLKLSAERVREIQASLDAQGFVGDSFDEAVLIAMEEKMALFGDASETAAGALDKIEANVQDIKDAWAEFLATAAGPVIEWLAAIARGEEASEAWFDQANAIGRTAVNLDDYIAKLREANIHVPDRGTANAWYVQAQGIEQASNQAEQYTAWLEQQAALGDVSERMRGGAVLTTETLAALGMVTDELTGKRLSYARALDEIGEREELTAEQLQTQIGYWRESAGPIEALAQARADLAAAEGEWVQRTITNSGQITRISEQLAADLSNDQKKAYSEILGTVDEGSAEWLSAYQALQNDLTDSQRSALIAQRAELEGAAGQVVSIYTGDAEAAEDAQRRIEEANAAMTTSYKQMVADAVLAREGVTEETLNLMVAMGLLTDEQADERLQYVEMKTALDELTASTRFYTLDAEQQATAVDLLIEGYTTSAERAITLAGQTDLATLRLGEMRAEAINAKNALLEIPEDINVHIGITSDPLPAMPTTGGGWKAGDAAGARFNYAGGRFAPGESLIVGDGPGGRILPTTEMVVFGQPGMVLPGDVTNALLRGGGAGGYTDASTTIITQTKEAMALALATVATNKRRAIDTYMGVG